MDKNPLNEPELPDDYPIYGSYLYVGDGKTFYSNWHGVTAAQLKKRMGIKTLCRCDIVGRQSQGAGD